MKSHALIWKIVLLSLASAVAVRAAGPQSSADYFFTNESIDGGGLRVSSAHYTSAGSFGTGNFITSADCAQRGGYVGQLNNAPVATNYTFTIASNSTIKVPISVLLSAATDSDGDSISFVSVANASAHDGAVARNGIWLLYKPPAGFVGTDTITWVMQDSEGDQSGGTVLAQVIVPPSPSDTPTLNLISVTFDTAPDSTDATLRFASLPGTTYTVQYTDSLTPPVTWTTLGTAATTNGVFIIVDPTARNASQRYYRTVVQSP